MAEDTGMPDADAAKEQRLQYGSGNLSEQELDAKYPTRPKNVHKTLHFRTLFEDLFNPLLDSTKRNRPPAAHRRQGPHGQASLSPHEARRNIIERYIARWRKEVGNDIYPAMRLIIPEKDRDRAMYGLKEKAIAKLLIRVMKLNKDSEDAKSMVNWKLPGQLHKPSAGTAGDFAARCYEALSKRSMRDTAGDMSIGEVNEMLDKLSIASKEEEQYPIFMRFYRRMCAEEMTWLIRIILRQMKIGATEKTILDIWHPDAETLFNVSSNLRRVCWELYDPKVRLNDDNTGITLMQCFQPQLAAFQKQIGSFDRMVQKMKPEPDDDTFWIEEKLDGERMQLHMVEDDSVPGGKRFGFWSRKAKDYAYLYGDSFDPKGESALTRFIKDAFAPNVRNIILDGEMITWDMDVDKIVGFGTLKTAAISEKENRNNGSTGQRPLFRVFDCLYLNDTLLAPYTLRDRRNALTNAVRNVHRRLEIHPFIEASSYTEIEPELRKVVANSSEGLVLKNPRSMYRLNDRNDDWIKVKPEYMSEFGESLDCVVVGGYFGSGHRGGAHSSFLCGLLVKKDAREDDKDYGKCYSFFKVGGGFSREDYAAIRGRTEGKWKDFDARRPPSIIELGGHEQNRQHERPDQWIHPSDSIVVECKAASVESSDKFRLSMTLRFPRFKQLRTDKGWKDALSIAEFMDLKAKAEQEHEEKEKEMKIEQSRRKKLRTTEKKPLTLAGNETVDASFAGPTSKAFEGLNFYIMTDALSPFKKTKAELEAIVKSHGGKVVQREFNDPTLIIIADKRLVKVSSVEKRETHNIIKSIWIFDCIAQAEADVGAPPFVLPFEGRRHMFHLLDSDMDRIEGHNDEFGDSYTRDMTDLAELKMIFDHMPKKTEGGLDRDGCMGQAEEHELGLNDLRNYMFSGVVAYLDVPPSLEQQRDANGDIDMKGETTEDMPLELSLAANIIHFGGGKSVSRTSLDNPGQPITHAIVLDEEAEDRVRQQTATWKQLPRIVGAEWVQKCWEEGTRVDEERFCWG